jgi:polyisoprenoid-binding protein YceI
VVTKVKGLARAHPFVLVACILLLIGAASAAWVITSIYRVDSSVVYFGVPNAPQLTAGPGQTLYRVNASRSSVTYGIDEELAGTTHRATGSTKGIAGDIVIDEANPSASQVGDIVVNVQQLTSDQSIRDERIRHEGLQSNDFPLATLRTTSITGMPAEIADGTDYSVQLHGDLTVKATTAPVVLDATARRENAELQIKATTQVKLSTFDAGPIRLVGFVSTGDDVTLDIDLVAGDPAKLGSQSNLAWQQSEAQTAGGEGPSFKNVVQPILQNNCAACHAPGEAGASIWQLDTARDAAGAASGLALVTQSRYMPPWPASDLSVPFQHSMKLSDEDLQSLQDWASTGGQLDVDPNTKIEVPAEKVTHPRPDVELRADQPYQGSTDKTNDYRCFVMDPGFDQPTAITGYEFVPDQKASVHHALVYRMSASSKDAVEKRDADDPGTGYGCYGGVGADLASLDPSGAGGGADLVAGWAPGQLPGLYPDGSALQLKAGDFFVVQIHYHFVHFAPPDRSSLVLQVGDKAPGDYDNVKVTTYLAPAEIPCGPMESGPFCDRSAVLQDLGAKYGPTGPIIADGLNLICGTKPEQIGLLVDQIASSSCDHRVRNTGQIMSVLGHMHELGSSYRMTLNPGTPDEKVLLDIPKWDFNWQLNYAPVDNIVLKRGDVIRVECSWDRDLVKPANKNRYVTWAEGTEDEMCFSTITTREPHK